MTSVTLDYAKRNLRKRFNYSAREPRRQYTAYSRYKSQHHLAGGFSAGRLYVITNLLYLPNKSCCAVQEQLPRTGENHAAAVSSEELDLKFTFEQLDLPAKRRLSNSQAVRCLAETPQFRHRSKGSQLPKFHRSPLPKIEVIAPRYINMA
jgi:hypothetical protein